MTFVEGETAVIFQPSLAKYLPFALASSFALSLAAGCARPARVAAPSLPRDAAVVISREGDPRVGTYVSSRWSFATNSFWIEGPTGLVLIDTQFLPSAAAELVDFAERATGKKVVAAIVLHANPDKFNGTATLQARGIRVLTSKQVAALIPSVHEKRVAAFYDRYAPDYPKEAPKPEVFGDHTTDLSLAGLTLRAHVLGAGCSEAHVAIEWEDHLFVGDLVGNGTHAWLEIGKPEEWLARLGEVRALSAKTIHPGRGASGGTGLLDREEAYLRDVIAIVAAEHPKAKDDEAGIARVKEKIVARHPGLEWAVFLELGVPAVWSSHLE